MPCQVQHPLAVTGKKEAHICVLICGHETRIFKVTRSESVIQHIINAECYFWEYVEKDTPPDVDASESAAKALHYPKHVPLSSTDLSEDEQANQQLEQLIQTRDFVRGWIRLKMKDCQTNKFTDYLIYFSFKAQIYSQGRDYILKN
ncbi:hypothetical protein D3C78_60180 [compost metagenome]